MEKVGEMAVAFTAVSAAEVRSVWASNLHQEFPLMMQALGESRFVAMDTEFPGFVHHTSVSAGSRERYEDVRRNVNSMKIIQLGLSFFDAHGRRRSWEINFSDFDLSSPSDLRWDASIELLKQSGIDFARTRAEGVDSAVLSGLLRGSKQWTRGPKPLWVTFHGLYDVAYLLKLLTRAPLPQSLRGFACLAGHCLGRVVDVKCLGRVFQVSHLGLVQLSQSLGVIVFGRAGHQAGVDSLIAGMVYAKMAGQLSRLEKGVEGILYGIEDETIAVPRAPVVRPSCHINGSGRAPLSPRMVAWYSPLPPRHINGAGGAPFPFPSRMVAWHSPLPPRFDLKTTAQ